jgi:porphobilinogen synthase
VKGYPDVRLRRLRLNAGRRRIFDDPLPPPQHLIWPVFVKPGSSVREPIGAMPGQYRYSTDTLLHDLERPVREGIGGVLLFGLTEDALKDRHGTEAWAESAAVQQSVRAIKSEYPELPVFTDVCLCAYTSHGHCGPLCGNGTGTGATSAQSANRTPEDVLDCGVVDNDAAVHALARIALSHAQAGADGVAPSAMMDGQVAAIRAALSESGFNDTLLMSYSTKFASSMYGPFREAENSAPQGGDRKGYQASFSQPRVALREGVFDENEGADIIMVKPALWYLDVIARMRERSELPIAAYNVSGEYSMMIAAAEAGYAELGAMVRESFQALQRAGTDIIVSYWANRYSEFF